MRLIAIAALPLLAGCIIFPVPPELFDPQPQEVELPFFGTGYRAEGDQCRRVGESDYTNQFLDDAADLVGCPSGMENLGVFALDTGGVEVARTQNYVLYSVPVR